MEEQKYLVINLALKSTGHQQC